MHVGAGIRKLLGYRSTDAFGAAARTERERRLDQDGRDRGCIQRRRDDVRRQTVVEVAAVAKLDLLDRGVADRLERAALDLALGQHLLVARLRPVRGPDPGLRSALGRSGLRHDRRVAAFRPAGAGNLAGLFGAGLDDPLAGEAYTSLAHVYEAMKKPEDALRIYSQIAERFPQTHWAQNALQRMSALKSK